MSTEKYLIELLEIKDREISQLKADKSAIRSECYEIGQRVSAQCRFSMAETDDQKALLSIKNDLLEMSRVKD